MWTDNVAEGEEEGEGGRVGRQAWSSSACTLAVRLDLLINLCIALSVQTTLQMMLFHKTVTFSSADGVFSASSFLMTIFVGCHFQEDSYELKV
jgi:hypothetical protein